MERNNRIADVTAAICLLFVVLGLSESAGAQQPGANNRTSRTDTAVAMKDLNLRDSEVRSLEIAKDAAKSPTITKAAPERVEQVRQDFGRIQEINVEVLNAYRAGGPPDYKQVSRAMAEINKRARRLSTNLTLPDLTDDETYPLQDRSPLLDLNDLIVRFVTNPIFKNPNTFDADLAIKAKRDLVAIIELSRRIEKSAQKLAKNEAKPR